ncbi:MAG: type VI secretion system tip protein VgrG [Sandaracinaceae bacterium]|nr:type VI secretion system tip protein VgrG [Sandaracinaceae bacterium]
MADGDSTLCTIAIDGTTSTAWSVSHVETVESIFAGYRVQVRAVALEAPELDAWIGKDATVVVATRGGERSFHGVVLEIGDEARPDGRAFLVDVVVGARIELLKLGRDHRIFQDKTVPDIVREVIDAAGFGDKCEWSINATYEPHAYVVQYGESDYDFITRLLHEEGIGFFVQDTADAETYVFFDDDTAFTAIDGESLIRERGAENVTFETLLVTDDRSRVASDKVMLRDYDFASPGTDLSTTAETPETTSREVYLHPGGYIDTGRGQRLADRLLERLQALTRTIRGSSDCVRLAPGRYFTLSDAAREGLNGDFVVLEAHHRCEPDPASAGEPSMHPALVYECEIRAFPVDVPYRPQLAAPPPWLAGVQPAFVTVPGGEEIHSEELGRVKVRFPWDRSGITDDKSSTWLRVGQVALGGSMILPRVDFEVLVGFEMGDLDRPAISGHLYNADKPPPYALPGGKTRSSIQTATTAGGPGANELRFEDSAGAEEIFINASKDLIASVDNETSWNVTSNQTRSIGSNNTLAVTADHNSAVVGSRASTVSGNQSVDVGGDYGDGTGGDLSLTISGMRKVQVGGDHNEASGGTLSRTVGSMQIITGLAGVQRAVVGDSTTTVSALWAELAGRARGLSVTGSYTETISAAKLIKAKSVTINCGAAYTMNAAAELVKAGGGRTDDALGAVALTAGGALKIKATNIVIEAKSKLVFRGGGGVIELTKAGMVKVKAPSITIKNAKALNQIMHKSN